MELKTMICPHCGARLKIKQSGSIKCEYCDSDIFIEDSDINSQSGNQGRENLSTEINSGVLKKWKTKRKVFIAVHFICVFMAWLIAMHEVNGVAVLFLLAGFSTFLLFPVLIVFSRPMSDAERANFKKGKAVFGEYLIMLLVGIIAFMAGAILGYMGVG